MNHRIGQYVFALLVGLVVALFSYRWITSPEGREIRAQEEQVVQMSRQHLATVTNEAGLEIVDPLAKDRVVGKAYVYPEGAGWVVSGFYRRDEADPWHPYLMSLKEDLSLAHLKTADTHPDILELAASNPHLQLVD